MNLHPEDLEKHNIALEAKYATITEREVRWAGEELDDAEVVIVAYGTAARIARTAMIRARESGLKVGLFRPITLWPFPSKALAAATAGTRGVLVVELSSGQMVEDVRLAIEGAVPVFFHGRTGGMLPAPAEVLEAVRNAWAHATSAVGSAEPAASLPDEPDPFSLIEEGAWRAAGYAFPDPVGAGAATRSGRTAGRP